MADAQPAASDDNALPSPQQYQQQRDRADSLPAADIPAAKQQQQQAERGAPRAADPAPSPRRSVDGAPQTPTTADKDLTLPGVDPMLAKHVESVMSSEVGIPALLNRLKQSISSTKEFAVFLRKRAILEEDHAQGLKKLCRQSQESARRPEHRQGSFARSYDEMIFIHDRMAENSSHFAASLHTMHEELIELAAAGERGRKSWKATGMAAEQKVADLEQVMRKSKAKYDALADEYDRARTGEARQGGGKVLDAFKAHKSAAQQEEDLLRKVQAADQAYHGHVNALQAEKTHLLAAARPEAVKALHALIAETNAGVTLQMQKFAFNEKLLLGNGMIVSPVNNNQPAGTDNASQSRSLRQAVAAINNAKDLNEYLASQLSKVRPISEVKYERNPILGPPSQAASQHAFHTMHPSHGAAARATPSQGRLSLSLRSSSGNNFAPPAVPSKGGMLLPSDPQDASWAAQQQQPRTRSFSHGNVLGQTAASSSPSQQALHQQQQFAARAAPPPQQGGPRYGHSPSVSSGAQQGAPQLGALPFQPLARQPAQDERLSAASYRSHGPPPAYMPSQGMPQHVAAPSQPVFGVPLGRLYERDGVAVPLVVYQCIQAVDLFGLSVEGIYRQSGSLNHINKLKGMFDTGSQNPALDFRNPENFYHDVNSVTGLLKQFFRDLPDPLLTTEHHDALILGAKQEDNILRRDSLHTIINALPDPNYATLRALALHLYRVMDKAPVNRMNSHNLAVIFGPTLMGSDPSTAITDAGWQIKVINTILQNTYQIFDD